MKNKTEKIVKQINFSEIVVGTYRFVALDFVKCKDEILDIKEFDFCCNEPHHVKKVFEEFKKDNPTATMFKFYKIQYCKNTLEKFIVALEEAGYLEDEKEYKLVIETETKFAFIAENGPESYLVGTFCKERKDYLLGGCEGTLETCVNYMREFV